MDLGAYVQIELLEQIAKQNNIDVPRLRGYRLMSLEKPINIVEMFDGVDGECCKDLCQCGWGTKDWWSLNAYTDYLTNYYTRRTHGYKREPRWERIHGYRRRKLKFEIKKQKKAIRKQYEVFNKYCGREDILYIHARIGGGNWSYYCDKVQYQPWFLEKVDDSNDSTYCDIYAKINPITLEQATKLKE